MILFLLMLVEVMFSQCYLELFSTNIASKIGWDYFLNISQKNSLPILTRLFLKNVN